MEGVAVEAPKEAANQFKQKIIQLQLRSEERLVVEGPNVIIPLARNPTKDEIEQLKELAEFKLVPKPTRLVKHKGKTVQEENSPTIKILNSLNRMGITEEKIFQHIPQKWEKLGHVVVLKKLSAELLPIEKELARAFAESIGGVRVVCVDEGGVQGELREPVLRTLFIDSTLPANVSPTLVTHSENGILYQFDVSKIMFASGNGTERMFWSSPKKPLASHGNTSGSQETVESPGKALGQEAHGKDLGVVVDMFSGIGYFTLPIALSGRAEHIYALEKNFISHHFLKTNLSLNGVEERVTALCGDNREIGEECLGVADHVFMGYIPTPREFLPRAASFLKTAGGVIHYHLTCRKDQFESLALEDVKSQLPRYDIRLLDFRVVKSYAPKVFHCVADIFISPMK